MVLNMLYSVNMYRCIATCITISSYIQHSQLTNWFLYCMHACMYCARPWNENNMYIGKTIFWHIVIDATVYLWLVFFMRIYSLSIEALVPEICAIFCWQVMKMCHIFLTSGICREYTSVRFYLVKTLVPEICAIFCWQIMKMFHLFLTSGSYVERPQMIKMKTYLVYTV
jgi:hypothetical protein